MSGFHNTNSEIIDQSLDIGNFLSVTELVSVISDALSQYMFNDIWIKGEVTNYTFSSNQNLFFTLQDSKASIDCVSFKNQLQTIKESDIAGKEILVHGSVDVYKQKGRLQLIVDYIYLGNQGSKQAEYLRLKEKLNNEGLFDISRKKNIPKYPKKIGIITSKHGAVIKDLTTIISRRWPLAKILISHSSVQGKDAKKQIQNALHIIENKHPDITIIARGGGAQEDFDVFNEEEVVRAIYQFKFPIVTALGHQENSTLSDLVADFQAATPSEAAEMIVPNIINVKKDILDKIQIMNEQIYRSLYSLKKEHAIINNILFNYDFNLLLNKKLTSKNIQIVDQLVKTNLLEKKLKSTAIKEKILALSPNEILNRGYSIIANHNGKIINTKKELQSNSSFVITVSDGSIQAKIGDKN